jgi:hypothetical protein
VLDGPVAFSSKHEEEYEQNCNDAAAISTRKIPMNFEESLVQSANKVGEVLGVLKDQPGTESNEMASGILQGMINKEFISSLSAHRGNIDDILEVSENIPAGDFQLAAPDVEVQCELVTSKHHMSGDAFDVPLVSEIVAAPRPNEADG